MYPSSCSRSKDCGRTLYNVLYKDVGGQVPGEGPCGIYYNIIPHEAHYIAAQGKIFGCYQASNLRPAVFTYDPITNVASSPVNLGGSGLSGDSHGAPAMCIDASGYIRVFWGCHSSTIYYRKSTNPWDVSTWDAQQSITETFTYPSIFYYDGYWYLFHRTQSSYPLGWGWNRTSDFSTWSSLTEVIKSSTSTDAYYATLGQDGAGGVGMFWSIWDGSIYKNLYYAHSSDLVTWRKADGTAYESLPINTAAADLVFTSAPNQLRTQTGDVQFDSQNRPFCLYNSNLNWKCAHWDGEEWIDASITTDTTVNLHVAGCLVLNSDTNLRAYLQFSPVGDTGAIRCALKEYRSYDAGATWSFHNLIQRYSYRGCLNHVVNGADGYLILGASSENDEHDIWIH